MKKPINKCKDKSFVKIPGVSGYLINKIDNVNGYTFEIL